MLVYNVTVKIENSIHEDWLNWMKTEHIPEVMATGMFLQSEIFRIMVEETDGVTYSIQYRVYSQADLDEYQTKYAPALQAKHSERYANKFVAFRTLLEHVPMEKA